MPFLFEEIEDPMWQFLCSVKRPSRYAGGEWGADGLIPPEDEKVSLCLAFPDAYEVGMSYLGFQLLYSLASETPGTRVERSYCPWPDAEALLRKEGERDTHLFTRVRQPSLFFRHTRLYAPVRTYVDQHSDNARSGGHPAPLRSKE